MLTARVFFTIWQQVRLEIEVQVYNCSLVPIDISPTGYRLLFYTRQCITTFYLVPYVQQTAHKITYANARSGCLHRLPLIRVQLYI